jgi:hypothetical protein
VILGFLSLSYLTQHDLQFYPFFWKWNNLHFSL